MRHVRYVLTTYLSLTTPIPQAFADILQLKDRVDLLTTDTIKAIHSKLMRTSKVQITDGSGALHYINAGCTRQTTQKSAVVRSHQYNLAFCPAERVDQQLDYICKMGRVRVLSPSSFPFGKTLDS
jgi:hypothetical protein